MNLFHHLVSTTLQFPSHPTTGRAVPGFILQSIQYQHQPLSPSFMDDFCSFDTDEKRPEPPTEGGDDFCWPEN